MYRKRQIVLKDDYSGSRKIPPDKTLPQGKALQFPDLRA
jgi:hypothetical protein